MKSAAEEATDVLEGTYATAAKGASDYGLKVIEAARSNTNAHFDFATELMTVKSFSELVELSTAHMRKQYEALTMQSKDLGGARPEGGDRHGRAGQGKRQQDIQEVLLRRPSRSARRHWRSATPSPGQTPGLSFGRGRTYRHAGATKGCSPSAWAAGRLCRRAIGKRHAFFTKIL